MVTETFTWQKELPLSAKSDDIERFKLALEIPGCDIGIIIPWEGRRFGSHVVSEINRTALMIAAMYGSVKVLDFVLESRTININGVSSTDKMTALNCAHEYDLKNPSRIVKILTKDYHGKATSFKDLIFPNPPARSSSGWDEQTDEFMMFVYKIKPFPTKCSEISCPYAHPENGLWRRDFLICSYSPIRCSHGRHHSPVNCLFAHGDLEEYFHPERFRTTICPEGMLCETKICHFAHSNLELRRPMRPYYPNMSLANTSVYYSPVDQFGAEMSRVGFGANQNLLGEVETYNAYPTEAANAVDAHGESGLIQTNNAYPTATTNAADSHREADLIQTYNACPTATTNAADAHGESGVVQTYNAYPTATTNPGDTHGGLGLLETYNAYATATTSAADTHGGSGLIETYNYPGGGYYSALPAYAADTHIELGPIQTYNAYATATPDAADTHGGLGLIQTYNAYPTSSTNAADTHGESGPIQTYIYPEGYYPAVPTYAASAHRRYGLMQTYNAYPRGYYSPVPAAYAASPHGGSDLIQTYNAYPTEYYDTYQYPSAFGYATDTHRGSG